MKDEGIVQAISKEMEQLSRRLHQSAGSPEKSGEPASLSAIYDSSWNLRRRQISCHRECAAYIAGLIDGEGTITLTRLHAHENRRLVVSIANTEIPAAEIRDRRGWRGKDHKQENRPRNGTRLRSATQLRVARLSTCSASSPRFCGPISEIALTSCLAITSCSRHAMADTRAANSSSAASSNKNCFQPRHTNVCNFFARRSSSNAPATNPVTPKTFLGTESHFRSAATFPYAFADELHSYTRPIAKRFDE